MACRTIELDYAQTTHCIISYLIHHTITRPGTENMFTKAGKTGNRPPMTVKIAPSPKCFFFTAEWVYIFLDVLLSELLPIYYFERHGNPLPKTAKKLCRSLINSFA